MSSYAGHTRRGAKARRTTNQPTSRMASPENQQEHRHKTNQDHGSPNKGSQPHNTLARQDNTWAETVSAPPGNIKSVARLPTYHTVAKDQDFPYPFAKTHICSSQLDTRAAKTTLTSWCLDISFLQVSRQRGNDYRSTVRMRM